MFEVHLTKLDLKRGIDEDFKTPLSDQDHDFINVKNSMISPVASQAMSPHIKYGSFDAYCD